MTRPSSLLRRTGFAFSLIGMVGCGSSEPEQLTLPDWLTEPATASADSGAAAEAAITLDATPAASTPEATTATAANLTAAPLSVTPVQPVSLNTDLGTAAAVFDAAPGVALRTGDGFRYARTFETVVQQDDTLSLQSRLTCTFRVAVTAVQPERIDIQLTFERFVLDQSEGDDRSTVDTMIGDTGLVALVGQSLSYRVSPQNELLSVDQPDAAFAAAIVSLPPDQRRSIETALGVDVGVRSLLGPAAGLPLARVQTPAIWTTAADGVDRHDRRYQTQAAVDGVRLQYAGQIAPAAPQSLAGSGIEVTVTAGSVQGEATIDPVTAMPKSARSIETLAMTVAVADGSEFTQQTQTIATLQQLPDSPSFAATPAAATQSPAGSTPSAFAQPPRATVAPVSQSSTPGVVTPPPYFQRP